MRIRQDDRSRLPIGAVARIAPLVLVGCLGWLAAGCAARHLTYHATDPRLAQDSERAKCVPLFLPRTVLEFRCRGTATTLETSELYRLAAIPESGFTRDQVRQAATELGLRLNTNTTPQQTIKLDDAVLTTRGERDPSALFFIRPHQGCLAKTEFSAQFSPDGVPGVISSTVENRGFEFAMKTIEVMAGVAGRVVGLGLKGFSPPLDAPKPGSNQLALVVDQIRLLRQARQDLITARAPKVPTDDKTLGRMLDEIDAAEAGLAAWFKGESTSLSFPVACTIRPSTNYASSFLLADFGNSPKGVTADQTHAVYPGPLPSGLPLGADKLILELQQPSADEDQALQRIGSVQAHDRGLPFRVPARVHFRVIRQGTTNETKSILLAGDTLIAQWGVMSCLPPSIGSPGSTFKPVYYTETGALKELTVSGTPLSPDSLKSLDTAAGSITGALKTSGGK